MLRTNPSLLSYITGIYERKRREEDVMLKSYSPRQLLLKQDSKPARVYIIKEGITKCYFSEDNGKDYIFEFLGEGEIVGEIEAIRHTNCLCNIEALTDVQAFAIDISYFGALLNKDTAFNHLLLNELAERLYNTSTRSASQQLYTIEHGLKKILALQSRQNITISKEDIAAYLGVTLRSLNRTLKDLKP